jgi:biofilm PGA synthesis N-glycosyltransferase PgaC
LVTAQIILWLALALTLYTYVLYPLVLLFAVKMRRVRQANTTLADPPPVSIVISVYNEDAIIGRRISNIQESEYPKTSVEIVIGSDASTDNTDAVLSKFESNRVRVFRFPERRGKASVLNDLIASATGEIIIFTDANTEFGRQTIKFLVNGFADPSVGAVCGNLVLVADSETVGGVGEFAYWTYENFIKRLESNYRTVFGATGGVYAIRKSLYTPLPTRKPVTDDLVVPLRILEAGYTTKYESRAVAYEESENSVLGEFRRKARIGAQNFSSIIEFSKLLHPRRGFVAFALWSHKIVRWIVPFLILAIAASSLYLSSTSGFYGMLLYSEGVFVAIALAGLILDIMKIRVGILGVPYYFLATNAALLTGFIRFVFKREKPMWNVNR